ncbi:MAG: HlyD family type I secretion periplasmic adaptor subunit [Rickettsiaceae bacterium]|nr:MAG: HlyD family type I secretion periplasmic adaptor subunit [Rickettsiaceae bacterium]
MQNDSNTPEKLLLNQITDNMKATNATENEQIAAKKNTAQRIVNKILSIIQNLQHKLDRFINFVTKPNDKDRNDVIQAARSPILFGTYVIIIFLCFGGLWSVVAPLNSAVIAIGTVVPSTNRKVIQHQEGGIVKNIYVKPGDIVKEGEKLIELEDTNTKSKYESSLNQYRTMIAMESRLVAERDNLEQLVFPDFLTQHSDNPEVAKIMHTQENLFKYRKEIYKAEKDSVEQKILQYDKQVEALDARKISIKKNMFIMVDRLKALKTLQDKGFASKVAVLELESREANLKSEQASTESDIAKTKQEITRTEIENLNIDSKRINQILGELREVQTQGAAQKENYIALTDIMKRIVIKSPVDGVVNNINIHTIGGIISPGHAILEISPTKDNLVIEAKIPHKNIDSVHVGLFARIRFSAFKSRTTPLFSGTVVYVSPDIVQDRSQNPNNPGDTYYIARIEIDMDEFNKVAKVKKLSLQPGMQSEVQIVTGTRTLFRYLLDPVTDTMFKAFREK